VRSPWLALAVLLVVGAGVQAAALAAGKIPWNSDQAVVGLMAKHIVEKGEHPIFYYGAAYAGALEPHFVAAVFLLLGPTPRAYEISLLLLLALLSILIFAIGRRSFGNEAALFAVAYLAVPPMFFLLKGLTSDGAYDTLAVLGAAMLLAALAADERLARDRPPQAAIGLLGLLAGLAWWVDPLAAYFYLAIFLWFLLVQRSVFRRWLAYPVFLLSFALGSLPWWIANVRGSWPSLRVPEAVHVPAVEAAKGLVRFWTTAVPVLFGARPFYVWPALFPGAEIVAFAIYAMPVLFAAAVVLRASPWRKRHGSEADPAARPLLLLSLLMLCMQFVVSWNARAFQQDPRFLFSMYLPFALLIGFFFSRARRLLPLPVVAAAGIGILAFHAVGIMRAPREDDFATQATTGRVTPIIQALEERGLTDVYASYWLAYRLAFESGEKIRAASFGSARTDRYPPYAVEVARSRNPAVILTGSEADAFALYLEKSGAHADRLRVGPYVVFWNLPANVVELLARIRRVPDAELGSGDLLTPVGELSGAASRFARSPFPPPAAA
jgi:4-amino-4-deoxy-L-arabinose transferase-like glycosyltransferase